jgi:hypothetical protein
MERWISWVEGQENPWSAPTAGDEPIDEVEARSTLPEGLSGRLGGASRPFELHPAPL